MSIRTIRIENTDITVDKAEVDGGECISLTIRDLKMGQAGTIIHLTKPQAMTLGDLLKVIAA